MKDNKHLFALHTPELPGNITSGSSVTLHDVQLRHRIIDVLRLTVGDQLTLFTATTIYQNSITHADKKGIRITVHEVQSIVSFKPTITLLLPLLKKEALESALTTATIMGIMKVQFVSTEKSRRSELTSHELERFERVTIAAAEQSKQYALPTIQKPIALAKALEQLDSQSLKLFADPQGQNMYTALKALDSKREIVLCMGPEGDMTEQEKKLLKKHVFAFCRLTPSILRSEDALMVLAGIVRSLDN